MRRKISRRPKSLVSSDAANRTPCAARAASAAGVLPSAPPVASALDRTVHLSYGETPAEAYVTQLAGDFVIHSWDLARGIGADERLDTEMLQWVYEQAEPQADLLAQSGLFDPPVDVPADADLQTKTLALFGRRA